jgi:hypothetical protein
MISGSQDLRTVETAKTPMTCCVQRCAAIAIQLIHLRLAILAISRGFSMAIFYEM